MRDHYLFDSQMMFFSDCNDGADIVSGVYDHTFMRAFVADDGAIALEHPNRKNFMNHVAIVSVKKSWSGIEIDSQESTGINSPFSYDP